ncbi:MAG: PTS glucose transporter subunit IIA [Oscillospiraceae bacterium]
MGVDTVYLKGEVFKCFVAENQQVKRGDLIFEMDLQKIIERGKQTVTPVIIMDKKINKLFITDKKVVTQDDKLFDIEL